MISITMFGRCGEERKERGAGKGKGYESTEEQDDDDRRNNIPRGRHRGNTMSKCIRRSESRDHYSRRLGTT